jgi:two-component system response regulator YesN
MYNILIVDDEPLVRRGIKSLVCSDALELNQIFEAENGVQALEIFKKNEIQIVLADINMPKMNGLDLSKLIKEEKPSTKIAIITGYEYFDYARTALKIGIDDYILKPISKKDASEIILGLIKKIKSEKELLESARVVHDYKEEHKLVGQDNYETQIRLFIEAEIANTELSLSLLAEKMGLSQGYLSGLFKRLYGISFQDYLFKSRMEQAKILLLTTDLKNYQIAEQVGYYDPNYFSIRFKKYTGMSPSQYRKEKIE